MTAFERLRAHLAGLHGKIAQLEADKAQLIEDGEFRDLRIAELEEELGKFRGLADEYAPADGNAKTEPSAAEAG